MLARLDTIQAAVMQHLKGLTNIEAKQLIQKQSEEVVALFPGLAECLPLEALLS